MHVGQHAVVDHTASVVGYELLFRSSAAASRAHVADQDAATARVLVTTFLDFGLRELVGDRQAFVNLPRAFLVGAKPLPFPPDQVVLEVLEDVPADAQVLAGLERLREEGYAVALDDVTPDRHLGGLLSLADYVKVDVDATPDALLPALVDRVAGEGRTLLAEKVETPEQWERCRQLGFELFQGFLFSRPQTRSRRGLSSEQVTRLRLLSLLSRPDVPVTEVFTAVQADPAMCVQVLRASNSVAAATAQRVESLEQAVLLLGRRRLQGWAVLLSLGSAGAEVPLTAALTRARTCQVLAAREVRGANPHAAFLVGMLSALVEPLGVTTADLTQEMPLAPDVLAALEGGSGPLHDVLQRVLTWEAGEPGGTGRGASRRTEATRSAYLSAVSWTREVRESVLAA